jgi:hypothetical protein
MSKILNEYIGIILTIAAVVSFVTMLYGAYGERYMRYSSKQKDTIGLVLVGIGVFCTALAPWSQVAIFNFNGIAGLIAAATVSVAAFVAGPAFLGYVAFTLSDDLWKKLAKKVPYRR